MVSTFATGADYERFTADEVVAALSGLDAHGLSLVEAQERSGKNRESILRQIDALQARQIADFVAGDVGSSAQTQVSANRAPRVFYAPPGWPPTPEGWTPPFGWQPDPSWPAAPAGWVFWSSDAMGFNTPESMPLIAAPGAWDPPFSPPAPAKNGTRKYWVIGTLAALVLGVLALSFVASSSSGPKGYNDPVKLGADIAAQITDEQTDGSSVDVSCIHLGGPQFTCHSVWSDSTPDDTFSVTVNAEGTNWITGH